MSWRRIGIYYGLSAALGLYLYAWHAWTQPDTPEAETVSAPIADAGGRVVDTLVVEHEGIELEIARRDARWILVRPAGLAVTSDLVEALVDTLTGVPPIEVLGEAIAEPVRYGLSPPVTRLILRGGGEDLATVDLGNRNPTRTAVYASRGDERVYLLGLNAQYYVELIYEDVARQVAARRKP